MPRKKAATAEPAATPLPPPWQAWATELERTFVALLSVCALFQQRDAETTLSAIRAAVERMSSLPLEARTLRVLSSVYDLVGLEGDDDESLCVRVDLSGGKKKRGRDESSSRPAAKRPLSSLPAFITAEAAALRDAIRRFVSRRGESSEPPALRQEAGSSSRACGGPSGSGAAGASASAPEAEAHCGDAWVEGDALCVGNFCSYLTQQPEYKGQLVHASSTAPRAGSTVPIDGLALPAPIVSALRARGVSSLYSHQAEALRQPEAHTIVSTPTSSGKSLVYTVPAIAHVLADPFARSLFLYPTKALAADQLGSFSALADAACPSLYAAALDGDTSAADRKQIASRCHVILSNPDLLHATLLPHHANWREVLANLKVVVVDEAHAYHGVFGSHVALVLRRLRRICRLYGASPRFVCCSATICNPAEHMASLTGLPPASIRLVASDGSPSGRRTLALWNPPPLHPSSLTEWHEKLPPGAAKRRASALGEASRLLSKLVGARLRTIAFVKTRSVAERLLEAARAAVDPSIRSRLACYRAGYLKERRREVEAALSSGELLGVVATNALELGVDIGCLDCTLHLGYPGTTASLAQQSGRAGRGGKPALAIVIGQDNPLEQHLMACPQALTSRPLERTVLHPTNAVLLRQHLLVAARELPLRMPQTATPSDRWLSVAAPAAATSAQPAGPSAPIDFTGDEPEPELGAWSDWSGPAHAALRAGELCVVEPPRVAAGTQPPATLHAAAGVSPAISLRAIDSGSVRLILTRGEPPVEVAELETMEESAALLRVYDGAVYLHDGGSYLVDELDLSRRVALLHREDVGYYTEPRDHTRVAILGRGPCAPAWGADAYAGPVTVSKAVYGYRKCARVGGRLLELCDSERPLPPIEYDARGLWLELPSALRDAIALRGESYARGGLHAIEHLAIGLAPLVATCDPSDLGCQCTRRPGDEHAERLLIFERRRGGIGLADALLAELPPLLEAALARLESCGCERGCLACVHMPGCGEYNEGLEKAAAVAILRWLLRGEAVPPPEEGEAGPQAGMLGASGRYSSCLSCR